MVTLSSAENALKTVYLGVVANQLNVNANPLLSQIKQTTSDVCGKEIKKLAPYGINGGIGAGTETGDLPIAGGNNYVTFTTTLKNLYGKIEISDKAIRASQNNSGAFVNLLNDEMEGLIKASTFNLGRMLFGDGTGLICNCTNDVLSDNKTVPVDDTRRVIEGMIVDAYVADTLCGTFRVKAVDRPRNRVTFFEDVSETLCEGYTLYVQGSKDNEINGIESLFSSEDMLYGLSRTEYKWLKPFIKTDAGEISDSMIQEAIDFLEENSGSEINYISCSGDVRRAYQEYLGMYRRNIDVTTLAGGFKAITYNGIPVVYDRFVENGTLYLLNTKDFNLHQLCDWRWLEGEDGRVLHQNYNKATYSATLVKYADLICDRPNGQAKITGISTTISKPLTEIVTTLKTNSGYLSQIATNSAN